MQSTRHYAPLSQPKVNTSFLFTAKFANLVHRFIGFCCRSQRQHGLTQQHLYNRFSSGNGGLLHNFTTVKHLLLFAIALVIISILAFGYFCPASLCQVQYYGVINSSSTLNTPFQWYQSSNGATNDVEELAIIDRLMQQRFGVNFDQYMHFRFLQHNSVNFDQIFTDGSVNDDYGFKLSNVSNDVMVFMHMQKTGGSAFDRHLVRDLDLPYPCKCEVKRKKKCRCFRSNTNHKYWLFSRYSIGWKCGLHADYTEMINCVDRVLNHEERMVPKNLLFERLSAKRQKQRKVTVPMIDQLFGDSNGLTSSHHQRTGRRYYYVTLLRDPIARFISEFKHVQRGATWKSSRHWCAGRLPTQAELPRCFRGPNWRNVTLDEFIACPHNLAFNRQTRMLADLSLVNCYNQSAMSTADRNRLMLYSAKRNLRHMFAFFGLCEEQLVSQYVFERTFQLRFKRPFVQFNRTFSVSELHGLPVATLDRIKRANHLDIQLYTYARELFRARYAMVKNADNNFDNYYKQLVINSSSQQGKRRGNFGGHLKPVITNNNAQKRVAKQSVNDDEKFVVKTGATAVDADDYDDFNSYDDPSGSISVASVAVTTGSVTSVGVDDKQKIADTETETDSVEDYYSNHIEDV